MFNARSRLLISLAFVAALGLRDTDCRAAGGVVKAAARTIDDLLEWSLKVARPAARRTDGAYDALEQTLKRMRASGDEVSDTVARLIKDEYDSIPLAILRDDTLLRLASRSDQTAANTFAVAKRVPVDRLGQRLETILDGCPLYYERILKALSATLPIDQSQLLLRGISGREVSNSQVQSIIKGVREACDGQAAGEVFELLCRQQINGGVMKPKITPRAGTQVVDGRYNAIHGIDGVGIADDGVPMVLEFTIDESKNLAKTGQLSPAHVMDRWNRLMVQPTRVTALRNAGVPDKYLKPIDEATAKGFHRKLVAHNDQCLSESNRIAADLGMNDLMVLGK